MHVGEVCSGVVTRIEEFGAFVEVDGVPGLIRNGELSWGRILHPSYVAKVGDTYRFKVLRLNDPTKQPEAHFIGSVRLLSEPPDWYATRSEHGDRVFGFKLLDDPNLRSMLGASLHNLGYCLGFWHTDEPLIRELDIPVKPMGSGKREFILRLSQNPNQDWRWGTLFDPQHPDQDLCDLDFDPTKKHPKSCHEVWADEIADAVREAAGIDKETGPIFEVDGSNFSTFGELIEEFNRNYIQHVGGNWSGNLNAFNDYLCWCGPCVLRWHNADKSRAELSELFDTLVEIIEDNEDFVKLEFC